MKSIGKTALRSVGILAAASALAFGTLAGAKAEENVGDPIGIGFNAPLSGPVAGWGLPGLTGLKISGRLD